MSTRKNFSVNSLVDAASGLSFGFTTEFFLSDLSSIKRESVLCRVEVDSVW